MATSPVQEHDIRRPIPADSRPNLVRDGTGARSAPSIAGMPNTCLAPPSSVPHRLVAILRRQAGVVSRAQALAAGYAPHEVDRWLARRRVSPVHPRVYLAAGYRLTDEARVRAALLWAGNGAVVAGLAAAWWHGLLPRAPATIGVTVSRRCPAPRPGVRTRRLVRAPAEVVTLRGVAVPVRPLAVLEAAVEAGAGGSTLLAHLSLDDRAVLDATPRSGTAALLLTGVTSAPRPHLREWTAPRNRYS
jgi:hypothetical protein